MTKVLIYDSDPRIASVLVDILVKRTSVGSPKVVRDWTELRHAVATELRSIVVLGPDCSEEDHRQALKATTDHPGTGFLLVADELDATTLKTAMRHGIRDVVGVKESETDLGPAIEHLHALLEEEMGRVQAVDRGRRGKVVTVFGPKGGTGKTVIATNLAVLCAQAGIGTALLDADVYFGDCAASLRLRPQRNLNDITGVTDEVDDSVLRGVLSPHASGLKVLCAPQDPLFADNISPEVIGHAIRGMQRYFDLVVVDTGPSLDRFSLAALESADLALLVTSLDLAAVKNAKVALGVAAKVNLDTEKIRIVLNRADSKVGFPPEEVGKALAQRVAAEMPSDVAVPRSLNEGVTVAESASRSKAAKAMRGLAEQLRGELLAEPETRRSGSLLARAVRPRPSES